jgi:hypothetical protein
MSFRLCVQSRHLHINECSQTNGPDDLTRRAFQGRLAGYIRRAIRSQVALITASDLMQDMAAVRRRRGHIPPESRWPPTPAYANPLAADARSPTLCAPFVHLGAAEHSAI